MVEIDDDLEVARRRGRRLVHDRDLFRLGPAFQRVAQAEETRRDNGPGRGASKAIDRPPALVDLDLIDVIDGIRVVVMEIVHLPTVCPIPAGTSAASRA